MRYLPLAEGTTRRTAVITVEMRRGPGVIRLAEGPAHARLHIHSVRVAGILPARDARRADAGSARSTSAAPEAHPAAA